MAEIPQPPVSKTQRKAAMTALQQLGVRLTQLPADRLAQLDLPEPLREAVVAARGITSHGALRRQHQYLGSLMRTFDTAPIAAQLQRWDSGHSAENARFHELERLRDALLTDERSLPAFLLDHPKADSQQLRTLIRNHQRELAAHKPPKSSRALFKLLREITDARQETEPPD